MPNAWPNTAPKSPSPIRERRSDDASVLREHNINIDTDEIVGRGVIDLDDVDYLYVTTRGRINAHEFGGKGLSSITLVDCPADSRMRFAIWFGPNPLDEKLRRKLLAQR